MSLVSWAQRAVLGPSHPLPRAQLPVGLGLSTAGRCQSGTPAEKQLREDYTWKTRETRADWPATHKTANQEDTGKSLSSVPFRYYQDNEKALELELLNLNLKILLS